MATQTQVICDHCGDPCIAEDIIEDNRHFCCSGCATVYSLLASNDLSAYYQFVDRPGSSQRLRQAAFYDFLDDSEIINDLLSFDDGGIQRVVLELPQIHCSSCLWLLEHLNRLEPAIMQVTVDFAARKAVIQYKSEALSLRQLVELLDRIGYPPALHLDQIDNDHGSGTDRRLLYKLGLAGFSFGNIMLLSFPEYLGYERASVLMHIGYINLVLAIPVLLYSGIDYLKSAWQSIRSRHLNIDVPVAIGMVTLFLRSAYEILAGVGEGYLDSFAGFVFFLLIGRWFQRFTVAALDFDRSYTSYFPISATVKQGEDYTTIPLRKLSKGDQILVRNEELVPADGRLLSGKGRIDYSFVTGESELISKETGEQVLAGGKQRGDSILIEVDRPVQEAYLTQLWNEDAFNEQPASRSSRLISLVSTYFTYCIIAVAGITMAYWWYRDASVVFDTFTAVLIVACPCALALSIPFTYGNILRLLSARGFYLRHVDSIELMQEVDHIIFDKTGTLTDNKRIAMAYQGRPLTERQQVLIKSACIHSSHPLSRAIVKHLEKVQIEEIDSFKDIIGAGIVASKNGSTLRLGSSAMIFDTSPSEQRRKGVFIEIDGRYIGVYTPSLDVREGAKEVIAALEHKHKLAVLSGDSSSEEERIKTLFTTDITMLWEQQPKDKLNYIKALQAEGKRVMMIGDGLNDAGALKQSDVGLVIADEVNNFSPACEGIIAADQFKNLAHYIRYTRLARYIIIGAMGLAFLYNSIGLYFAITAQLSPVVAAILMPVSSISVIIYGVVSSGLVFKWQGKS